MRRRTAVLPGIGVVCLVAVLGGFGLLSSPESSPDTASVPDAAPVPSRSVPLPPPTPSSVTPSAVGALADLDALPVKGRAPKTGYSRPRFGAAWDDAVDVQYGRNGCRTREDILRRDLVDITVHADGCRVLSGTLVDAYSGKTLPFTRGQDTSALVQIDHVVALSDAWQKGAAQWDAGRRLAFANDPRNLQAVSGTVNQSKGAGDAATWLPPNKAYRCTYVSRQIEVKKSYGLWVTAAEREAMSRVLSGC
ncbi:HNH endonuclease family protein [Gordonia westfalica]|uniref:HNH endonuclease family protein n=1 Tax=Gordonia westfalica TaxID=158898 RepID=A0ABU2GXT0_9ACTN|nr:HNH endonuclease family protein [Gordonia westfalica]MDS1116261.1 HNH endonuclease family protein [Gordonia westfalica]